MRAVVLLGLCSLLAATSAASEVRVPMQVDLAFLRGLLVERSFTDPDQTARVYSDGVECNRVTLLRPVVDAAGARLRVTSDVDARFGTLALGLCLFPVPWQGRVESELEPWLDPALPLVHFRVVDSAVLERDGSRAGAASVLWDWVKRYVHPRAPPCPRNASGKSPGASTATTLYSHATPAPSAISVNILSRRVTGDS